MRALVNTKNMLLHAYDHHYAVGAFNVNNMEVIQVVAKAAKEQRSPVILQASSFTGQYADLGYIVGIAENAARLADVPVALHLDHGEDLETCKEFIQAGFTSVMIDGSHLPYEENVALTRSVCEYAHRYDITVEGELGTLAGVEDGRSAEQSLYTDPEQARDFAERTGVDSLAIAIGTSHGAYKFKPGQKPMLRFDILEQVSRLMPRLPIVLHGASSVNQEDIAEINAMGGDISGAIGIPEEMLAQASRLAVCKINVDTDLRLAMTGAIRKYLHEAPEQIDYRKYIGAGRDHLAERVSHKMKNVFLSAERY